MISLTGFAAKDNIKSGKILRFTPAVEWEVTDNQKPIDILRLRRIYNKLPSNYWFKKLGKRHDFVKIRVTVEEIFEECKDPSCDGEYHYEICCKPGFVTDCCCQGHPIIKEDCPNKGEEDEENH